MGQKAFRVGVVITANGKSATIGIAEVFINYDFQSKLGLPFAFKRQILILTPSGRTQQAVALQEKESPGMR